MSLTATTIVGCNTSAKQETSKNGVYTPIIQVYFASTRWNRDKMEKALIPSAYGGVFLK